MKSNGIKSTTIILVSLLSNSIMLANVPFQAPEGLQTDSPANSQKPTKQAPISGESTTSQPPSETVTDDNPKQPDSSASDDQENTAQNQSQSPSTSRDWTSIEIVLSVAVILFGLIIMGIQTFLMVKLDDLEWTPSAILRFHGLTMIITAGLLILTASYSQQQMAPVLGLLGTIAGYLLGSSEVPRKKVDKTTQEKT